MKVCLMYWSKCLLLPSFLEFVVVFTSHVVKILLSRDSVCRNSACGFTNHSEHPLYYNHNSAIVFCSKLSCGWEHTQLLNWNIDNNLELVTSLCKYLPELCLVVAVSEMIWLFLQNPVYKQRLFLHCILSMLSSTQVSLPQCTLRNCILV